MSIGIIRLPDWVDNSLQPPHKRLKYEPEEEFVEESEDEEESDDDESDEEESEDESDDETEEESRILEEELGDVNDTTQHVALSERK